MNPQLGAIGFTIGVEFLEEDGITPFDLTGFTVNIVLTDPRGTQYTQSGTIDADPTTGIATYTTSSASDFGRAGIWTIQGYASQTGINYPSEVATFRVLANS